jgi:outer membrane lipoprotein-sorting protein
MAFATAGLAQVAYGNGQKLWIYNSTDTSATIGTSGYFSTTTVPLMAEGDIILVTGAASGAKTLNTFVVSVINSTGSTLAKTG